MKKKDLNSLRTKDIKELEKILKEKKTNLLKIKVQMSASKEKNLKQAKMLKKEISQVSTIIVEKRFTESKTNQSLEKVGKEES